MLAVVVFGLLLFGRGIFRGESFIGGDVFFYTYPLRAMAWEMIRGGQLPLWTPHVLSGYPLLAMAQLGLGYPLTWGHLFLPARHAEMIHVLAPFLLAPAFTYAYLREVGRSRLGALLAGLSFGYGGLMTNTYGMNGVPTNALMWLPLLLIGIERARRRHLARSVAGVALAYAMSILTGHGQSFLFVGMVASAYALFLAFTDESEESGEVVGRQEGGARAPFGWRRLRPLFACAGGMLLAVGISAFQILETMRAARRSIRSALSYEFFVEGSFTPLTAWRSFYAPLYHYIEVTTYVGSLAACLAVCAVAFAWWSRKNSSARTPREQVDVRVYFWAATALVALLLLIGDSTPLYQMLYRVPVFNLFRRPSRHVFEWTFALSALAAYGWDALNLWATTRTRRGDDDSGRERVRLIAGVVLLSCAAVLGACWWQAAHSLPYVGEAVPRARAAYVGWKIFFTLAVASACYCALTMKAGRRRRESLSAAVVLLACFVEPFILVSHWWPGTLKTASRLATPARATRHLQQFDATQNRVYVRATSAVEEYSAEPRFDAHNLTALYGLHNVAGYEQLMFERYSRALGGMDYDAVNPRPGREATLALFAPGSHVLDLLNATRVVTFANLATAPEPALETARLKVERDALDTERWRSEAEFEGVVVLRNSRALPRAWLVAEAEAVDGEEALRRITGESEHAFAPRRTALLEVAPEELPKLAGGALPPESVARVASYEPTRIVIETKATVATVLVVSEINYPGWEATVDGAAARVHATNYLLRGVFVPAGERRIEMRYRAPAARNGAIISVVSLCALGALIFYSSKKQTPRAGAERPR
jgi:hypothetical protein